MSKVKVTIISKDGTKKEKIIEMPQVQQDAFIHYLDDHYPKMRTDDLK